MKLAYKKLRLLVDRGCIFIGHGLSKDFRTISECYRFPLGPILISDRSFQDIFVPPEQVIDTVDLYFIRAKQRRLSLRFLSWFVLHEHIQTDTHDSIEDARSALKLYKAYHELEERGIFDQKLEELYKQGRLYVSSSPPTRDIELTPLIRISNLQPAQMQRTNCYHPQRNGRFHLSILPLRLDKQILEWIQTYGISYHLLRIPTRTGLADASTINDTHLILPSVSAPPLRLS